MERASHGKLRIGRLVSGFDTGAISRARATQMIQTVIDNRNAVLVELASVPVPADAGARECHAAFRKAMQYSVRADECYLDWAAGWESLTAANPDNKLAGRWKDTFVRQYNSLAAEHGVTHDRPTPDF